MSTEKILESIATKKFNQAKSLITESMSVRIGLILEQELERLGAELLTEKKKEKKEEEEDMDPVGEEDGDIDNDGDEDDSDEYLAKRRAAIRRAKAKE